MTYKAPISWTEAQRQGISRSPWARLVELDFHSAARKGKGYMILVILFLQIYYDDVVLASRTWIESVDISSSLLSFNYLEAVGGW